MSTFGELPDCPEGKVFPNRLALSRAGVHRQAVAGITGLPNDGAESIVLSGGYEDDLDYGDLILYTGQGGNDPKSKRQVGNQTLIKGNAALVRSYLEGLPVRVIRGERHNSDYSPVAGYRYDGLFRVAGYWQDEGFSGFRIWRFLLEKIQPSLVTLPKNQSVHEANEPYRTNDTVAPIENALPNDLPVGRQHAIVSRLLRNPELAIKVKRLHDYCCQVCGLRLETPVGPYAEAAHIRPLGLPHNGPDTLENILCLCPNHHILFDAGAFVVEANGHISGTTDILRIAPGHVVNKDYLAYHRSLFASAAVQALEL